MTEVAVSEHPYAAPFAELADRLPGAGVAWIHDRRQQALERFVAHDFPGREEAWRYTDVRPIARKTLAPAATSGPAPEPETVAAWSFDEPRPARLVIVDGHFRAELSDLGDLPEGVSALPMSQALEQAPAALADHLGRYAEEVAQPFTALNTAYMTDGLFLHVGSGVEVAAPIHVLYLTTGAADGHAVYTRSLIVADPDSAVTVVEDYVGLSDEATYLEDAVTEVVAADRAAVDHYQLRQAGARAYHITTARGQQEAGARWSHHDVCLGARLTRNDVHTVLAAEGAHVDLNGFYLGDGRQHVDNHTRIDHQAPRCTSREFYKGVLAGHSRGVFNGRVVVYPEAQGTDSDQQNKNLLLSRDAEVDPKPELEIFADDVACAHGATVGELDEDALFFLRTRGLDARQARNVLVHAFAAEILERQDLAPLRERLEAAIHDRLDRVGDFAISEETA
jgi:Fe-S cluster assembly protein SufD